jgi:hypothetical protein
VGLVSAVEPAAVISADRTSSGSLRAGGQVEPTGSTADRWSFGTTSETNLPGSGAVEVPDESVSPGGNVPDASDTTGPQKVDRPLVGAPSTRPLRFGSRGWRISSNWEGVVLVRKNGAFQAELTPIVEGKPDRSRREVAEFDVAELSYASDRDAIEPGSVFYWTVGPRNDEAGTRSYVSVIRLQRTAPAGPYRRRLAADEARKIVASGDQK